MDKNMLDIVKYSIKCEERINALNILIDDYKRQAKNDIPIKTIEMIIKPISEG